MRVARALVDGMPRLVLTDGVIAVVAPEEHTDPLALLGADGSDWPSINLDGLDFLSPVLAYAVPSANRIPPLHRPGATPETSGVPTGSLLNQCTHSPSSASATMSW